MSEPTKPDDDIQVTLPAEFFDGLERMVRFVTQGLDDGTLGTVRRADTPPPSSGHGRREELNYPMCADAVFADLLHGAVGREWRR